MAIVGYGRVSTIDQDLAIQRKTLKDAGAEKLFMEKVSGTSTDGRKALKRMLGFVREGDAVVVTRIDRLARSLLDLEKIVKELRDKGVDLKATEQPIDTSTPAGRAFLQMLGVFAEFETNLRRERQMEGIEKAKAAGKYKGGKRRIDRDKIKAMMDDGVPKSQIARRMRIARLTVQRIAKELEAA